MPASYFSFLCACLRGDLEAARKLVSDDHWNWESLLGRAKDELILPAIAESIRELDLAHAVPAEVTELLAAVEILNTERNQVIVDELKSGMQAAQRAPNRTSSLKRRGLPGYGSLPEAGNSIPRGHRPAHSERSNAIRRRYPKTERVPRGR